jgi:hypothetical protein
MLLLQLPVVKSACAELIQETVNEETVPASLELADRCATIVKFDVYKQRCHSNW